MMKFDAHGLLQGPGGPTPYGDAMHNTFMALLPLVMESNQDAIDRVLRVTDTLLSSTGGMLRHPAIFLDGTVFYDMAGRDQYIPFLACLKYIHEREHCYPILTQIQKVIYDSPLCLTGHDVNILDNRYFLDVVFSEKCSVLGPLYNLCATIITLVATYRRKRKAEKENAWHAISVYSRFINRAVKNILLNEFSPCFLNRLSLYLMKKQMRKAFTHYFTKWGNSSGGEEGWLDVVV